MGFTEDEDDIDGCPECGGPGMAMGTLGRRRHYRCRDCGIEFSRELPMKRRR